MMILLSPEVADELYELYRILVEKGYLSSYESAVAYTKDIRTYVTQNISTALKRKVPSYFNRYGYNMSYITYRRSQHTTWYIMFETIGDTYLIKHITNNHVVGHFFNND